MVEILRSGLGVYEGEDCVHLEIKIGLKTSGFVVYECQDWVSMKDKTGGIWRSGKGYRGQDMVFIMVSPNRLGESSGVNGGQNTMAKRSGKKCL